MILITARGLAEGQMCGGCGGTALRRVFVGSKDEGEGTSLALCAGCMAGMRDSCNQELKNLNYIEAPYVEGVNQGVATPTGVKAVNDSPVFDDAPEPLQVSVDTPVETADNPDE